MQIQPCLAGICLPGPCSEPPQGHCSARLEGHISIVSQEALALGKNVTGRQPNGSGPGLGVSREVKVFLLGLGFFGGGTQGSESWPVVRLRGLRLRGQQTAQGHPALLASPTTSGPLGRVGSVETPCEKNTHPLINDTQCQHPPTSYLLSWECPGWSHPLLPTSLPGVCLHLFPGPLFHPCPTACSKRNFVKT